jgi:hypothetical protein
MCIILPATVGGMKEGDTAMITAIETTGTIGQNGRIVIDETFSVDTPTTVRIIVLFPDDDDISDSDWRSAAVKNEVFDFLADPEEDIYSAADGKPIE